ncbi:MAG: hypothetical protein KJ023_00145 [Burkholderiaceae bacterium]|nr:hypothetical protein [Burkholderiaceae bacterium]
MTPTTRPAGLAPAAIAADPPLHPMADALVLAVLRRAIAEEDGRGNKPGARALERVMPAVTEGVAALLRLRIDGLVDISIGPAHERAKP